MRHLYLFIALTACAQVHSLAPPEEDAGSVDAGTVDAGPDDAGSGDARSDAGSPPCEAPLVLDGEHCVGWFPAAPLPIYTTEAELVIVPYGSLAVRQGDVVHRYDAEQDRWLLVAFPPSPYVIDRTGVPTPERSERFVLGFAWSGTRVLLHQSVYQVEWYAQRDASDGVWRATIDPDPLVLSDALVGHPIGEDTILFAGTFGSALFVARPR